MAQAHRRRLEAFVYACSGAVLARDVERALKTLDVSYREIDEDFIIQGRLKERDSLFIVPAGYTARIISSLNILGMEEIRRFVVGGGVYIGICASAYIATPREEIPVRPAGLGIIVRNLRRRGDGLVEIEVANPRHPWRVTPQGWRSGIKTAPTWFQGEESRWPPSIRMAPPP